MRKILAVCGFGVGSSLLLKLSIDKALENLEIDDETIITENTDLILARGTPCDVIFTSVAFAESLAGVSVPIYTVNSYMNVAEVTEVVQKYLEDHPL